jgi:hypothetical protein
MAKALYLCQRLQPNLQTAVSFLSTQVKQPDINDWKKLSQLIKYIHGSKDLHLTLEVDEFLSIRWWVDASFTVHRDKRSHSGGTMSLVKDPSSQCHINKRSTPRV